MALPSRVTHLAAIVVLALSVTPLPAQQLHDFEQARMLRVGSLLQPAASTARAAKPLGLAASDGVITGTVRGLDAEVQSSAWVVALHVLSEGGEDEFDAATRVPVGDEGHYRLEGLEAGQYYVRAMAKEYETRYYDDAVNIETATAVEMPEDGIVEGIDFTLLRYGTGEGSIEGQVVGEGDGTPITGAIIHAFSPENPYNYGVTETDENGRYVIAGLRTGEYVVDVVHPEYLPELFGDATTFDETVLVEVVEPDATQGIDFGLTRGGSISGVVYDTDGLPVAGAYVSSSLIFDRDERTSNGATSSGVTQTDAASSGETVDAVPVHPGASSFLTGGWAVTDANGAYRMGGLPTGDYRVQAESSARWIYAFSWYGGAQSYEEASPVAVITGAETAGIDMVLDLPVTDSAIEGQVTDASGHPLADVFVVLQQDVDWIEVAEDEAGIQSGAAVPIDVAVSRIWANATTDGNGRYRIDELPAGSYVVSAASQSGWEFVQRWYDDAETPANAAVVELATGEARTDINFTLPVRAAAASISGTVRDQTGEGIEAFIEIRSTDSTTGQIVDPTGDPADGTTASPIIRLWAYGQADKEGNYRVDRLPAGTYSVHASYNSGELYGHAWYDGADSPETATLVILEDGDVHADTDFQLEVRPIYGVVAGKVSDASTGDAVPRAYVVLSPLGRDDVRSAPLSYWNPWVVTDKTGAFQLDWIPEGQYSITVYADGAWGPAMDFEVRGGETTHHDVGLQVRQDGDGIIAGRVTTQYNGPDYLVAEEPVAADAVIETIEMIEGAPAIAVVMAYRLSAPDVAPYITVTKEDGSYELRALPTGDYVLMCFAPGHMGTYYGDTYVPDMAEKVHVDAGGRLDGIDFGLSYMPVYLVATAERADDGAPASGATGGGASVHGHVADDTGEPITNATLYLLDADEQPVASAQTASDGSFELSTVIPGAYRVYAGKPGFSGAYNGNKQDFAVAEALSLADGPTEVNLVLSTQVVTAVTEETQTTVPRDVVLEQNFPNPFNPETRISFQVPTSGQATLRIYDALGQQVAVLFDQFAEAGSRYDVMFRASHLGAGVYYYRLAFEETRVSRPMVLVK